MGIDDDRKHENEDFLARRLKLVPGEAREPTPHQAPKLALVVNADRKLLEAIMANDARQVSTWLERGANPNARDADAGRTPLFEAVLPWKDPAIAELLLSRGANVRVRDKDGQTPLDRVLANRLLDPQDNRREPLARLLGGFMTARIIEARSDSLILRIETVHSKYPEADRRATERGTLTVPCGIFHEAPEPGQLVRCQKGLTPGLDEAWSEARRKAELDIERER